MALNCNLYYEFIGDQAPHDHYCNIYIGIYIGSCK